ncbi:MAG: hypothetical protein WC829_04420 [Hyphomicrobium sp.]|jgi:hypothetical protein
MTDDIDFAMERIVGDTPIGSERKAKNTGIWARHPEDYYIENEWCSERLFAVEQFEGTVVDPACGSGRIVRSARKARDNTPGSRITQVLAYDIVKRCRECHDLTEDFLATDYETDNIVSNPPFGLCKKPDFAFVRKALATADRKVALLLPLPYLTGGDKGRWLQATPLAKVLVLTPRPSMPPGPVIEAGENPGGGTEDFAWLIWDKVHKGTPTLGWLDRDA